MVAARARVRAARLTPLSPASATKDGEYDELDDFDLGVDDYLTKPVSSRLLVAGCTR